MTDASVQICAMQSTRLKGVVSCCSLSQALHGAREGTGEVRRLLMSTTFRPRLPGQFMLKHPLRVWLQQLYMV